jgi:hypothetical protein
MATRRGQAFVELMLGMFAITLVTSALCVFAVYIARSLRVQNTARSSSPEYAEPVEAGEFAERFFTGTKTLTISERAVMPSTEILR